jgi:predicted DNA-binding transcriptional regulator AlpA
MFLESITMTQDSKLAVISPFVHVAEAVKLTSCPRSTILKYSELGLFPPMVRLLGDRIAFIRADVQSWIDCRVASAKGVA